VAYVLQNRSGRTWLPLTAFGHHQGPLRRAGFARPPDSGRSHAQPTSR
jgi:hypothetical protein